MMLIDYAWAMPNHETFKIKPIDEFIRNQIEGRRVPGKGQVIIDPFARRRSDYGAITNDINPECKTDFNECALKFFTRFDDNSVDVVLYDPPYSLRQMKECYQGFGYSLTQEETRRFYADVKDQIARVLKPNGYCISFGWSTVGLGKTRNFHKCHLLIVCHGGTHNDTLCTLEVKM